MTKLVKGTADGKVYDEGSVERGATEGAHSERTYSEYIHKSRYARYLPNEHRREDWNDTVSRYIQWFKEQHTSEESGSRLSVASHIWATLEKAIYNHEVMPSMRALMTAGPALERDNVAGYNCAYTTIDDRRAFDEIMYILLCGTGVGFSVERKYVDQMPQVPEVFHDAHATITVADSKIGWSSAFRKLIVLLYEGQIPVLDYSRIRPAGASLKTFGGRASGPDPLQELFNYTINTFQQAAGRRLNSLECHDIVCKIAQSVVCGGVRRSALLSLSNLTDERLRNAKSGTWFYADGQRALANNSVCYTERPDVGVFLREWTSLYESKSGERGIFYRGAAERTMPDRRERGHDWGTNPCSEIILRPRQFCNLTEVVAREHDTLEDLQRKVELASILGTLQSTLTDFRYLGKRWQSNCEEERLLGVSITGIMDCPLLNGTNDGLGDTLENLKLLAIQTNERWAKKLGIPASAAITCVKPSGTVSQLVNSSSGIHPRYAPYYVRRVRNSINDPISQVLIDNGVPYEVDVTNESQYVFEFPVKAPDNSTTIASVSAIQQLELWKTYAEHWCEHKPSVSIYVGEDEWLSVASWVYDNFDILSGISFFPREDHVYRQSPYEECSEQDYKDRSNAFTNIVGWDMKEEEDVTTASQELACAGGACEL